MAETKRQSQLAQRIN